MNIVFLDIDGVLNSKNNLIKIYNETHKPYSGYSYPFDHNCLDNLKKLIVSTNSNIVVTSSWRNSYEGISRLMNMLKTYRLDIFVIGITPNLGTSRGAEITKFLEDFKCDEEVNFVILDDDSDMKGLSQYLIQTDNAIGLTHENVKQALELLNAQVNKKSRKL